jgi:flagellar motor switch protein FliN
MLLNDTDPQRAAEAARIHAENERVIEEWRDYLDTSLALAFELGRTKMTTRSILELEVDTIVQLTGSTGEGLDIYAGERRLARGEVIMIEDRTGVRINEVATWEEA